MFVNYNISLYESFFRVLDYDYHYCYSVKCSFKNICELNILYFGQDLNHGDEMNIFYMYVSD